MSRVIVVITLLITLKTFAIIHYSGRHQCREELPDGHHGFLGLALVVALLANATIGSLNTGCCSE